MKKKGPTEIRTRINGFKVRCDNRYTIGPIRIVWLVEFLNRHGLLIYKWLNILSIGNNMKLNHFV